MSNLDGKTLLALGDSLIYGSRLGSEKTWALKLTASPLSKRRSS